MSLLRRSGPHTARPSGTSILDVGAVIRGDIETEGAFRIDGRLEGSVVRADTVVVGAGATVVGDVAAREIVVAGNVLGSLVASGRVEVQPTGSVAGDIDTPVVAIHEGGGVRGTLTVKGTDAGVAATPPRAVVRTEG